MERRHIVVTSWNLTCETPMFSCSGSGLSYVPTFRRWTLLRHNVQVVNSLVIFRLLAVWHSDVRVVSYLVLKRSCCCLSLLFAMFFVNILFFRQIIWFLIFVHSPNYSIFCRQLKMYDFLIFVHSPKYSIFCRQLKIYDFMIFVHSPKYSIFCRQLKTYDFLIFVHSPKYSIFCRQLKMYDFLIFVHSPKYSIFYRQLKMYDFLIFVHNPKYSIFWCLSTDQNTKSHFHFHQNDTTICWPSRLNLQSDFRNYTLNSSVLPSVNSRPCNSLHVATLDVCCGHEFI